MRELPLRLSGVSIVLRGAHHMAGRQAWVLKGGGYCYESLTTVSRVYRGFSLSPKRAVGQWSSHWNLRAYAHLIHIS